MTFSQQAAVPSWRWWGGNKSNNSATSFSSAVASKRPPKGSSKSPTERLSAPWMLVDAGGLATLSWHNGAFWNHGGTEIDLLQICFPLWKCSLRFGYVKPEFEEMWATDSTGCDRQTIWSYLLSISAIFCQVPINDTTNHQGLMNNARRRMKVIMTYSH